MRKISKLISFVLCVAMLTGVCVSARASSKYDMIDVTNGEEVAYFYDKLLDYVIKNHRYEVSRDELLTAAAKYVLEKHPELLEEFGKGAFEALDENSFYYNEEEYKSRLEDVSGVFVGIGINVSQEAMGIMLGEAIPGAPAEGSGLQVGDILVAVDGENVENYALDKVVSLIKGEEGTSVKITVSRDGVEYTYTLQRALVKINPVSYYIVDDTDIAYLKLSAFNANTIEAITEAMNDLHSKGIETIILDLRNNFGGYMEAAIAVASYFVPNGSLVASQEFKDERKNVYHFANETDFKFKAVVLVNEYSASASEFVSGALKDYGTGTLVGQTTFGKGTVQNTIPLRSNHYLWYTIAEYYPPSHNTIHKEGVKPHYIITNKKKDFDMSTVSAYEITRVLKTGDTGADVFAVKERLKALGYPVQVNDVFDEITAVAISDFQANTQLFAYGVADITTQLKLNDVLKATKVTIDNQFNTAMSLAKEMSNKK